MPAGANTNRVVNLSARGHAAAEGLIAGFVIGPGDSKPLLIRVAGPSLRQFPGVKDVLSNPMLEVFDSEGRLLIENRDWVRPTAGAITTAADLAEAGAFPFASGQDAAISTRLKPGAYTVRARAEDGGVGLAVIEVYDRSGGGRLINLSTRAELHPGNPIFAAGFVVAPGQARRVLLRAIGPSLAAFGVDRPLPDPALTVFDGAGAIIGTNQGWGIGTTPTPLLAAFRSSGAFPLSNPSSLDSALLLDLAPGAYTAHVASADGNFGTLLFELYDLAAETGSVGAARPQAGTSTLPGSETVVPAGTATNPGTATNTGAAMNTGTAPSAVGVATPVAANSPESVLYTATLRLPEALTATSAAGHAAMTFFPADNRVSISLEFSGISSPQLSAHLRIAKAGGTSDVLVAFPVGRLEQFRWELGRGTNYTIAELVSALEEGRLFVSVETASFPTGELEGRLLRVAGSATFSPPASPPALDSTPLTAAEAGRFLLQATFGPTPAEIEALSGGNRSAIRAWIDAQMSLPVSSHLDATRQDYERFTKPLGPKYHLNQQNRHAAWWGIAVNGRDQLRQRVAFALSQIFVVSENNSILFDRAAEVAAYNDLLARHAFGNFRELLEAVALSPVMGVFLSHLRNAKAADGTLADENFARELMQLFTIGRTLLHPDGTQKLDASGRTIPAYDEATVKEMARVFTGWGFASADAAPNFRTSPADYFQPMRLYPEFHDNGAKAIVAGRLLPAGQGGAADLKATLDALFEHPNLAPFFSRLLIQRLVTSNPSPGYVYRVARAFADNGRGVRGDLGAVVRAVLTDYEARSAAAAGRNNSGKLREPVLRVTAMLRGLNGGSNSGRLTVPVPTSDAIGQTPLRAPSVFSFFEPDYVRPGPLANAGLYSPEFQTLTAATLVTLTNVFQIYLNTRVSTNPDDQMLVVRPGTTELEMARDATRLVDRLDARLTGGALPRAVKERIVRMLDGFPVGNQDELESRYRSVAYVILASPHGAIQR